MDGQPRGFLKRLVMQKSRTSIFAVALLAANVAGAGPNEDADREAARVATKKATAAFNLGHYDEAASLYEEAYTLVPDPILLYDLGQSYRQANKLDKALTAYRSYLRTASEDAPNRDKVQQWVGDLEWTSDIQAKAAAQKAAQKEQPSSPAAPAPPIPKPAEPARLPEPAKPAQSAEPQISHEPVPPQSISARPDLVSQAPQVEEPHSAASWKKWAPWVGLGVTTALGVATIAEGLSANSSFNNLQRSCGKTKTCTDSQVDVVRTKTTVTNVLLGLTAAAAAATGVAFYFNYSGSKETGGSLALRF